MSFGLGYFCGVASVGVCWYLAKLVVSIWLGPMLDKYDRGHPQWTPSTASCSWCLESQWSW